MTEQEDYTSEAESMLKQIEELRQSASALLADMEGDNAPATSPQE